MCDLPRSLSAGISCCQAGYSAHVEGRDTKGRRGRLIGGRVGEH